MTMECDCMPEWQRQNHTADCASVPERPRGCSVKDCGRLAYAFGDECLTHTSEPPEGPLNEQVSKEPFFDRTLLKALLTWLVFCAALYWAVSAISGIVPSDGQRLNALEARVAELEAEP